MLNIRMSRTPIEGSLGVLRPGEPTFGCGLGSFPELLSAFIPIGDTGRIGGFAAGQESAAGAAACTISGGMRA